MISTASRYTCGNTSTVIPGRHGGTVTTPRGTACAATASAASTSPKGSSTSSDTSPRIASTVSRVTSNRDNRSSSTSSSDSRPAICSRISSIRCRTAASRRASSFSNEPTATTASHACTPRRSRSRDQTAQTTTAQLTGSLSPSCTRWIGRSPMRFGLAYVMMAT